MVIVLERAQMLNVAAVLVLLVVGAFFAISTQAWADLPLVVTNPGVPIGRLV